jgi:hypothetical protein
MTPKKRLLKTALITISIHCFFFSNSAQALATPEPKEVASATSLAEKWRFKRAITIENQGNKVLNAVIQIQFNNAAFDYSKAKTDGADIRFSAASGNPEGAGLSHWTEQWNEKGVSRIWVKVPVLKARSKTTIYLYYGNSGAESVSNGNTTFLFFDDFEDGDFTKKWTNTSIGEVVEQGGFLKLKETDGQDGIITANFEVTGNMIVRTLYQRGGADGHWVRAGIGGWNNWLCFGDHTDTAASGTNYVMLFNSTSLSSLKSAPLVKAANTVITDQWRQVAYWYDGKSLKGKQDDVTIELPATNASSKLTLRTLDNDNWDNFAFVTVSAYSGTEPIVTVGEQKNK